MEKASEKALEELSRTVETLTERVRDVSQRVESITKERPLMALGAAFVVGLLLGVVIGSAGRRRD